MQSVTLSLNQLQIARRVSSLGGVFRELRVGILLGLASGAIVALIGFLWMRSLPIAATVAGAVLVAGAIGGGLGILIPRLVRHWKLNPTIASGPVALAVTDIAALACYFTLASLILV